MNPRVGRGAARLGRALAAALLGLSVSASLAACHPGEPPCTTIRFTVDRAETTSGGVFDRSGNLLRTLWRGQAFEAGPQVATWDGADDAGRALPSGDYELRVAHHRLRYVWEGVIGNSSGVFTGPQVHRSFLPLSGIAIAGTRAYVASRYNEQQPGIRSFELARPDLALPAPLPADPFAGIAMLAADAERLYAANIGGLSPTSFIVAMDLARPGAITPFARGQPVCLNRMPGSAACHAGQGYAGVIDVQTAATAQPTGLAVQPHGRVLAVAHGRERLIRLFDKRSGAPLVPIDTSMNGALAPAGLNQIAMAPSGDLWVIGADAIVRRYTDLEGTPTVVAQIDALVAPLAVAVGARDDDAVWVADGGASQQLKRFDRAGRPGAVFGRAGGLSNEPRVADDTVCFTLRPALEQTAIAVGDDGTPWFVDTCHNRLLHVDRNGRATLAQAHLPAVYTSTVDHGNPRRVFANFLEFDVDDEAPLRPGTGSWRLVRNWLAGLPAALRDDSSFNAQFGGLRSVETLADGRTYGMLQVAGRQVIVELPLVGPLRLVKALAAPVPGATAKVMHENGDLVYSLTGSSVQAVMRVPLRGFDAAGPVWASEPERIAAVPAGPGGSGTAIVRGAFSGALPPRFPVTGSGQVIFFDGSVTNNEGFHLGGARLGTTPLGAAQWSWQASPSGVLDGRGTFQTRAHDPGIQYGGNAVWAHGRHVLYGFHGEFYGDAQNGRVGQANQFMHFLDDGLFLGQFGVASTRAVGVADEGVSGNAFSPTLVRAGDKLYLVHNDESTHAGLHRWRIEGWQEVGEWRGVGRLGATIELR